jgi:TRAP-type C4-dicarboxylate transport system substrate-binding protein
VISVNNEALAELPEDVRAAFLETSAKWELRFREEVAKLDAQARADLVAAGMTLTEPTAEDAARLRDETAGIAEAWATANGELAVQILAALREGCQ